MKCICMHCYGFAQCAPQCSSAASENAKFVSFQDDWHKRTERFPRHEEDLHAELLFLVLGVTLFFPFFDPCMSFAPYCNWIWEMQSCGASNATLKETSQQESIEKHREDFRSFVV